MIVLITEDNLHFGMIFSSFKSCSQVFLLFKEILKCERGELNPYGIAHWILSPARLPVPPLSHAYLSYPIGGIGRLVSSPVS